MRRFGVVGVRHPKHFIDSLRQTGLGLGWPGDETTFLLGFTEYIIRNPGRDVQIVSRFNTYLL